MYFLSQKKVQSFSLEWDFSALNNEITAYGSLNYNFLTEL